MASQDEKWMCRAMELATQAENLGEVPVGAVVILDDEIIGEGFNQSITDSDPTAHAEIIALRQAASNRGNYRLNNAILYVTLEPCMMCAGAMVHSRIARLVYGAPDPKTGVIDSCDSQLQRPYLNHHIEVTAGVLANDCSNQLAAFFKARREAKKQAG